jgi:hypothetical protein
MKPALLLTLLLGSTLCAQQRGPVQPQPTPTCKVEDLDSAFAVIRTNGLEIQDLRYRLEQAQREIAKAQKERDDFKAKIEKPAADKKN